MRKRLYERIRTSKQIAFCTLLKTAKEFHAKTKLVVQKRPYKRILIGKKNTFSTLLEIAKDLHAKTKLFAQGCMKLLARKKAPATQKLCTTPSNNVTLAWLRMITGLIDDAHFRVMWMAWQSMEAQFCNNADLRMMPALPAAGTGDALESLHTFYNYPRDEDRTKKTTTSSDI